MATSYTEDQVYTRMKAVAVALQNGDSPEKDFRSLNCFAIGPQSFLNSGNLETEAVSDHFYSRQWTAAGEGENDRVKDWPLLLLLPPEVQWEDAEKGPMTMTCQALVLDQWKAARTDASHSDYATRSQEDIWSDTLEIARSFVAALPDRPALAVTRGSVSMTKEREFEAERLYGQRMSFTLRVVTPCDNTAVDPCADCAEECDDATVENSDQTYSNTVASGGTLALPDINHVDSDGSTVPTPAQTVFTATPCPDPDPASITVNGDSPALEVASGASQDIANVNSAGTPIGSRSGATITNEDMTLDYPDGTTEALVLVPGDTVTIDPELVITLAGTESSVTFTTPAWDGSFTVVTQTPTGGTPSDIEIGGNPAVASFVGQSLPASTSVTFVPNGATLIVLAF